MTRQMLAASASSCSGRDLQNPNQSQAKIVQSQLDIKRWLQQTPSAEAVRPGCCPACQAPSRPPGRPLGLWGHGLRSRQLRGPLEPNGPPQLVEVQLRRYLCRSCKATVTVGPRGVLPRRLYTAGVIAWALCLYGLLGWNAFSIRERLCPWKVMGEATLGGWATLPRWIAAVREARLFPGVRPSPAEFSPRQVAQRAAAGCCAHAVPTHWAAEPAEQAFLGGMHMA